MRKVWYHQIWIQKYLGFIVLDLMYMMELFLPFLISIKHILSDQKTPYIDSCWTKLWKKSEQILSTLARNQSLGSVYLWTSQHR